MFQIELDIDSETGKWAFWRKEPDGEYELISPQWEHKYHAQQFATDTCWKYEMKVNPNQTVHFRNGDGTYEYVEMWDNDFTCTCVQFKHNRRCPHTRAVRNGGYRLENQTRPIIPNMQDLIREQQAYVYKL